MSTRPRASLRRRRRSAAPYRLTLCLAIAASVATAWAQNQAAQLPVGHGTWAPSPNSQTPNPQTPSYAPGSQSSELVPYREAPPQAPVEVIRLPTGTPFGTYRGHDPRQVAFNDETTRSDATEPDISLATVDAVTTIGLSDIREAAMANSREITIVRYQRDEAAAEIVTADARFDPAFGAGFSSGITDQQVQNIIQSFGSASAIQQTFFVNPLENDQLYLERRLRNGARSRIGLSSSFLSLDPADESVFVNPGFDSRLRFRLEQPLLRGSGIAVNNQPIFIAKKRTDMSEYAFQASVNLLLRNVELAYWIWERDYQLSELFAANEVRRREIWEQEAGLLKLGRGTVPSEAQALEAYQNARLLAARALNVAVRSELDMHRVAGLPPNFESISVPSDRSETPREYSRDVHEAIEGAQTRPELLAQQAAIDVASAQSHIARDRLKPDLSVILDYSAVGLAEELDESFTTVGDFEFYNWTLGVRFASPIYRRGERAQLSRAITRESRAQLTLEQLRHVLIHEASEAHSQATALEQQIDTHLARIDAAKKELEARRALYENNRADLTEVMDAEDRVLQAQVDYRVALGDFQRAITLLSFSSGRIMESHWIIPTTELAEETDEQPTAEPIPHGPHAPPIAPGHSVSQTRSITGHSR